jgi:phosphotransferase system enzyme I (PtsI)
MGHVFLHRPAEISIERHQVAPDKVEQESGRFRDALVAARKQIDELARSNDIFSAHLDVTDDPVLLDAVTKKIVQENKNAELALMEACEKITAMFNGIDDEYLRERAADIRDVCKRILHCLKGIQDAGLKEIDAPVILVAGELTPSDTAGLDRERVLGFITGSGGSTSHVAIMARSLELPAIVGVEGITDIVSEGSFVILDAVDGEIIIDPEEDQLAAYRNKAAAYAKRKKKLEQMKGLPAITSDGHVVELCANVGNLPDVQNALSCGIDGIGLFRSEFLYMESSRFPNEEELFAAYKSVACSCDGEVILRTLDIGGDKALSYYKFQHEENPFLGWRAIRFCLEMVDVFKTQLRAILRASAFGKVKIMYPMIISVEELKKANHLLRKCQRELAADSIAFNPEIKAGIMIETPAAVFCVEELAKEADFFSIGTNDLTQYLLAVDRGNPKVSGLYDSFHPAVLRSIKAVIEAGHRHGIPVGMCGEFAGNEKAILLLLGMGLDEFSMSAPQVPEARYLIRNANYEQARALARQVDDLPTLTDIKHFLAL